ncbi:hypothetical protein ACIBEA_39815 [Streptomyces sp. NPDC051555]|uniref:hypothetical protein n=1 Tax=Streptomyces sp. NPDC051555 TaxID=3365657 RepID=UPI0037AAF9F0
MATGAFTFVYLAPRLMHHVHAPQPSLGMLAAYGSLVLSGGFATLWYAGWALIGLVRLRRHYQQSAASMVLADNVK